MNQCCWLLVPGSASTTPTSRITHPRTSKHYVLEATRLVIFCHSAMMKSSKFYHSHRLRQKYQRLLELLLLRLPISLPPSPWKAERISREEDCCPALHQEASRKTCKRKLRPVPRNSKCLAHLTRSCRRTCGIRPSLLLFSYCVHLLSTQCTLLRQPRSANGLYMQVCFAVTITNSRCRCSG